MADGACTARGTVAPDGPSHLPLDMPVWYIIGGRSIPYVCVCVCLYIHECVFVCIYVHVYIYIYIYMYMYM